MSKRSFIWVLVVFALLVVGGLTVRSQGDGAVVDWFRSLHG